MGVNEPLLTIWCEHTQQIGRCVQIDRLDRQTEKNKHTERQTGRQAEKNKQTDRRTGGQTGPDVTALGWGSVRGWDWLSGPELIAVDGTGEAGGGMEIHAWLCLLSQ